MELKEKWGLKEGWCWNDDKTKAKECLMLVMVGEYEHSYFCKIEDNRVIWFENFSETDPNQEELKVGELAYFWEDGWLEKEIVKYARLESIKYGPYFYKMKNGTHYTNCSHINPLTK